jgi:hypothetical protein
LPTGQIDSSVIETKEFVVSTNFNCPQALSLILETGSSNVVYGSTANSELVPSLRCSEHGGIDNSGVAAWFTVTGNGQYMEVSTCSSRTDFPTALQVLRGDCVFFECQPNAGSNIASDTVCPTNPMSSYVGWESESGQSYKIVLMGRNLMEKGDYGLKISTGVRKEDN